VKNNHLDRLRRLLTYVEFHSVVVGEEEVIGELIESKGATRRFAGGTYVLRVAGVAGTATSGSAKQLLASWERAARRKLAKAVR
jgi:hypothetical protein